MKITAAHIHAEHGRATLRVALEDGSEQDTISWYLDELTFTPEDAIGRTVEELRQLHFQRDRAYLQSCAGARRPRRAHAGVAVASRTSPRGSSSRRTARSR